MTDSYDVRYGDIWYGDSVDNAIQESSSSLI